MPSSVHGAASAPRPPAIARVARRSDGDHHRRRGGPGSALTFVLRQPARRPCPAFDFVPWPRRSSAHYPDRLGQQAPRPPRLHCLALDSRRSPIPASPTASGGRGADRPMSPAVTHDRPGGEPTQRRTARIRPCCPRREHRGRRSGEVGRRSRTLNAARASQKHPEQPARRRGGRVMVMFTWMG